MHFFDTFINNGRICMGFAVDNLEKVQKRTHLIWFSSKNSFKSYFGIFWYFSTYISL